MVRAGSRPAVAATIEDLGRRPCVVFDFDGTLGDTAPSIIAVAREVLLGFGLEEADLGRVGELIGPPFPQAFSQVFGLSEKDAAEVTRRYRAIYNHLGIKGWPAYEGVPEMLARLRARGKALLCASSKRDGLLHQCLADEGIDGLFAAIRGKETDAPASKADTIRAALREAGFAAGEAVMVGDRHYDVEAAAACGIPAVGVLYGHTATLEELDQAGAACVADSVAELEAVLGGAGAAS